MSPSNMINDEDDIQSTGYLGNIMALVESNPQVLALLRPLIESLLGKPGQGLDYITYDPAVTLDTNLYRSRRYNTITRYFGTINSAYTPVGQAADALRNNVAIHLNRLMGYGPEEAREAALQGNVVQSLVVGMLMDNKIKEASNQLTYALYSRRAEWDPSAPAVQPVDDSTGLSRQRGMAYMDAGGRLITEVFEGIRKRQYGGMSMTGVSTLAAQMIRAGAFDFPGEGINLDRETGNVDRRINRFSQTLNSYAQAVNKLQDVISGPVDEVISSFERLTGSRLVTTAAGRVDSLASAMRNVLQQRIIDPKGLATLTATHYGLISPLGGSLTQASASALVTAAALSSGVSIEGLDNLTLGNALAQDSARRIADGSQRQIATAYVHWRQANNRKVGADSREEFIRTMTVGGKTLEAGVRDYLSNAQGVGNLTGSAVVAAEMADPIFEAYARLDYVKRYEASIAQIAQRNSGGNEERRTEIRRALTGTYDPIVMQEQLVKLKGMSSDEAARIVSEVELSALGITGASTAKSALGVIGTARNAYNTLELNLAGDALKQIQGIRRSNGLEGVLEAFLTDDTSGPMSFARVVKAYLGMDQLSEDIDKAITQTWKGADKNARENLITQIAQAVGGPNADIDAIKEQISKDFDTALKYGNIGISILTSSGSKTAYTDVDETTGKAADEATVRRRTTQARQKLFAMMQEAPGKHTLEEFREASKYLSLSESDVVKAYLTYAHKSPTLEEGGEAAAQVSDDEVTQFLEARRKLGQRLAERRKNTSVDSDAANYGADDDDAISTEEAAQAEQVALDNAAKAQLEIKRQVDVIRAGIRREGRFADDKETVTRLVASWNDLAEDSEQKKSLNAYMAVTGATKYEDVAKELVKRDGIIGYLDEILQALRRLCDMD